MSSNDFFSSSSFCVSVYYIRSLTHVQKLDEMDSIIFFFISFPHSDSQSNTTFISSFKEFFFFFFTLKLNWSQKNLISVITFLEEFCAFKFKLIFFSMNHCEFRNDFPILQYYSIRINFICISSLMFPASITSIELIQNHSYSRYNFNVRNNTWCRSIQLCVVCSIWIRSFLKSALVKTKIIEFRK